MSKRICLALVILLQMVGCTSQSREYTFGADQPTQPTAAQLQHCPDGHAALKGIPIVAGLLYMTPELERKIRNGEVWAAGCSPMGNYKTKVICRECKFAYEPIFAYWEKRSEDADDFHRPLSPPIHDFPRPGPGQLASSANFYQYIRDDQVEGESLIYWTKEDFGEVKRSAAQFMAQFDPNITSEETASAAYPDAVRFRGVWHDRFIDVEVQRHGEMNQTLVRVDLLDETAARRHDPLRFLAAR